MTLDGTILNGVVVFDAGYLAPEGSRVKVVVPALSPVDEGRSETPPRGTLANLLPLAGLLADLPADFAAQHDHYIHGTPKR